MSMANTVKDLIIRQLLCDREDIRVIYVDPDYSQEIQHCNELFPILEPFYGWWDDDKEKNLEAKQALLTFYDMFKKLKPDQTYRNDFVHVEYLYHLLIIKKGFLEQKYMSVCNELMSLMHDEPFLQKRVYNNIIRTLEEGLGISENF